MYVRKKIKQTGALRRQRDSDICTASAAQQGDRAADRVRVWQGVSEVITVTARVEIWFARG